MIIILIYIYKLGNFIILLLLLLLFVITEVYSWYPFYKFRVATLSGNLEYSGNLNLVREKSGN